MRDILAEAMKATVPDQDEYQLLGTFLHEVRKRLPDNDDENIGIFIGTWGGLFRFDGRGVARANWLTPLNDDGTEVTAFHDP